MSSSKLRSAAAAGGTVTTTATNAETPKKTRSSVAPARASGRGATSAVAARIRSEAEQVKAQLQSGAITGRREQATPSAAPMSTSKTKPKSRSDLQFTAIKRHRPSSPSSADSDSDSDSATMTSAKKAPQRTHSKPLQPRSILPALASPPPTKKRKVEKEPASDESEEEEEEEDGSSEDDDSEGDGSDDLCTICSKPGELLVCDKCVHAFHEKCCIRKNSKYAALFAKMDDDTPFACGDVNFCCTKRSTPVRVQTRKSARDIAIERAEEKIAADKARAERAAAAAAAAASTATPRRRGRPPSAKKLAATTNAVVDRSKPVEKDDMCSLCLDGGLLYVCDLCVRAYHTSCLESHHADNYDFLKGLGDETPLTCKEVHLECTKRLETKKLKDYVPSIDVPIENGSGKFKWGKRIQNKDGLAGCKYFDSFQRHDGRMFAVGSFITLKNGDASDPSCTFKEDYVAEIESIYEQVSTGLRFVECRWLYYPEETHQGRLPIHHKDELFMTAHFEENELEAIQDLCEVLEYQEYLRRQTEEEATKGTDDVETPAAASGASDDVIRTFFIRQTYDHDPIRGGIFRAWTMSNARRVGGGGGANGAKGNTKAALAQKLRDMEARAKDIHKSSGQIGSVYAQACASLQLSSAPPRLPCRDAEHDTIKSFLERALRRGQSDGGLYIAGVPGTGKTATVVRIINELATQSDIPNFEYIEINAMKLPEPHQLYTAMWKQLTTKHATPAKAAVFLDQRFKTTNLRRPMCVLLVDELDYIMTRQQNVIYNLFDWPGRSSSRLIVIGISNTIDLPNLLMPRVQSRLGLTKIHFQPYTTAQIKIIIQDRLRTLDAFDEDAIELCARKIASVSGDIRRALQICRRAAEICEEEQIRKKQEENNKATSIGKTGKKGAAAVAAGGSSNGLISVSHILRSIGDFQNSNSIHHLRHASTPLEKALLCGMLASIKYASAPSVGAAGGAAAAAAYHAAGEHHPPIPLLQLISHTERNMDARSIRTILARTHHIPIEHMPRSRIEDWHDIVQQWSDMQIVQVSTPRGERWPNVTLNMTTDDIEHAFQGDEFWDKLKG